MHRTLIILLSVLGLPAQAHAIVTDRPDVAESSLTVPAQSLQLESGIDASFVTSSTGLSLPTKLRFGVLSWFELHLESGIFQTTFRESDRDTLYQDLDVGGKVNLYAGGEGLPSVGLLVAVSTPVGEEKNPYFITAKALVDHSITDALGVGINLGYTHQLNDRIVRNADAFLYAVSLGYDLLPEYDISSYVELFGAFPLEQNLTPLATDGGFVYTVSETLQFDAYARVGLVDNDEVGAGAGVGLLFD